MTWLLRFARLLAMVLWVGGLLFFAFLLAPKAFSVLPVREAGLVVGGVLRVFHPAALWCGAVYLLATAGLMAGQRGGRGRLGAGMVLAGAMLVATVFLQLRVLPAMETDQRLAGGDVNAMARENPARVDFDRLHVLSERGESVVLLCGLAVVGLMAAEREIG